MEITMTPNEIHPQEGEQFFPWLARVDASTMSYLTREHHSPDEAEGARRGYAEGQWATLFNAYKALDETGVQDARVLVGMIAAGLLAQQRRRLPLDFRRSLERHAHESPEWREHVRDEGERLIAQMDRELAEAQAQLEELRQSREWFPESHPNDPFIRTEAEPDVDTRNTNDSPDGEGAPQS